VIRDNGIVRHFSDRAKIECVISFAANNPDGAPSSSVQPNNTQ
jgi:hypothetical protein